MPTELIITYSGKCVICDREISTDKYMCNNCHQDVYAYSVIGKKKHINEQIGCPQCKVRNDSVLWDKHTILNWEMHEIRFYPSAIVRKEIHEKMGLKYRCPSCNEVVRGADLLRM